MNLFKLVSKKLLSSVTAFAVGLGVLFTINSADAFAGTVSEQQKSSAENSALNRQEIINASANSAADLERAGVNVLSAAVVADPFAEGGTEESMIISGDRNQEGSTQNFSVTYIVPKQSQGTISGSSGENLNPGQSLTNIPQPVAKTGYTFDNWQDQNGKIIGSSKNLENMVVRKDMVLSANFKSDSSEISNAASKTYHVTLEVIGGTFAAGSNMQFYIEDLDGTGKVRLSEARDGFTEPKIVADSGAQFWWWQDVEGVPINSLGDYEISEDCTLYAICDTDLNGDSFPDNLDAISDAIYTSYLDNTYSTNTNNPNGSSDPDSDLAGVSGEYKVIFTASGDGSLGGSLIFTVSSSGAAAMTLGQANEGFVIPTAVPGSSKSVFYRWEDASGQEVSDLENLPVNSDLHIIGRFEDDLDEDGVADIIQNGNGSDGAQNQNQDSGLNGDQAGNQTDYQNGNQNGDISGDPNDGSNVNQNDDNSNAGFADENNDGVSDELQNQYTITFAAGSGGKLSGQLSYVFIGGKLGDGIALTTDDVVNGEFALPQAIPDSADLAFKGWSPNVNFKTLEIREDMTFTAIFEKVNDGICFTWNGKIIAKYDAENGRSIRSLLKEEQSMATLIDYFSSSRNFIGWKCPDGVVRSTESVIGMKCESSMTFEAKFAEDKGLKKVSLRQENAA